MWWLCYSCLIICNRIVRSDFGLCSPFAAVVCLFEIIRRIWWGDEMWELFPFLG